MKNGKKCPVCNTIDSTRIDSYNNYAIYSCRNCSLIFCDPFKNPGSVFYEKFYEKLDLHNVDRFNINEAQQYFIKRNTPGKLIDIACGTGRFIHHAKKYNFNVYGLDFDSVALNVCKQKYRLKNVYNIPLSSPKLFKFGRFDYVTLIDVLEHVDNPLSLIQSCNKILKKDGLLVISVPNYTRKPDYIFKQGDSPPHHLTKWTTESLNYLVKNQGFKVVYCKPLRFTNHDTYMWIKTMTYDKIFNHGYRRKKISKRNGNAIIKSTRSSLYKYKIRDILVSIFEIGLTPITFIGVHLIKFESDHIYLEARKL